MFATHFCSLQVEFKLFQCYCAGFRNPLSSHFLPRIFFRPSTAPHDVFMLSWVYVSPTTLSVMLHLITRSLEADALRCQQRARTVNSQSKPVMSVSSHSTASPPPTESRSCVLMTAGLAVQTSRIHTLCAASSRQSKQKH